MAGLVPEAIVHRFEVVEVEKQDRAKRRSLPAHAIDAEVRLYDRLFTVPEPDAGGDFKSFMNANSLEVVNAKCEPALANARPEESYQFERLGYFTLDLDSTAEKQIWNRTATLRDTWARTAKK